MYLSFSCSVILISYLEFVSFLVPPLTQSLHAILNSYFSFLIIKLFPFSRMSKGNVDNDDSFEKWKHYKMIFNELKQRLVQKSQESVAYVKATCDTLRCEQKRKGFLPECPASKSPKDVSIQSRFYLRFTHTVSPSSKYIYQKFHS